MNLIHSHLDFTSRGIALDEPTYPGSSGRSTTQKYNKVKGSVGVKNSATTGVGSVPANPSAAEGYAQGVKDARSRNSDRRQSAY